MGDFELGSVSLRYTPAALGDTARAFRYAPARAASPLRLLPNASGVSVVLMLVDTLWRGTETLGRTQGLPRATIRLPDRD